MNLCELWYEHQAIGGYPIFAICTYTSTVQNSKAEVTIIYVLQVFHTT
jgi:hypothetical protein